MARQAKTSEVKRSTQNVILDHDSVFCAQCGEGPLDGPNQATGQPEGKGQWARECKRCGVVTWYDVKASS